MALGLAIADTADAQRRRGGRGYQGPGVVSRVNWAEDGKSLEYTTEGQRYRFNLESKEKESLGKDETPAPRGGRRGRGRRGRGSAGFGNTGTYVGRPTRGRQYTQVDSPDGNWQAKYEDWNVVLENKKTGKKVQVTSDGNETIHYGTASWVYGEELNQNRAMWWTADSKKLVFYRFDDTGVEPFHLVTDWSKINTTHYPEYYPKPGAKNPEAALMVFDLASERTTPIAAGTEQEHYLFDIRLSPGGDVMMVSRTDRLQHKLEILGMDLETGECRLIVAEEQDTYQANHPGMRFMKDQQRFIWTTEKSGFTHYELRDLGGKLHNPITSGAFQSAGIQFVWNSITPTSTSRRIASGWWPSTRRSTGRRAPPSTPRLEN
jgi:dipeptidyl-peptidase-4